jgi:D-arabinose 1-dehydrogenase-like Zn-dependent alcohol dehydrogenase
MTDALAAAAVHAVPPDASPVEVIGEGGLAVAARDRLSGRASSSSAPAAMIETTGEPREIEAALRRVDDLGTLVLAGPAPRRPVPLDLYADLHVRGLTVIGVAGAGETEP